MVEKEIIFILGGARAGKSRFAVQVAREREAVTSGTVCFIATAEAGDEEMRARIAAHRAERPSHWLTIEEPKRLDAALDQASDARVVIVDCLTLFVSNWLLVAEDAMACETHAAQIVENVLSIAEQRQQTIICISNEVGLGIVPETPLGRAFRDVLGRVNQRLAQAADRVYWLAAGLPIQIKPAHGTLQRCERRGAG